MPENLEAQIAYYNDRWAKTEFANNFGLERCIFILSKTLEHGLIKPRFLDLGCGTGWLAGMLSAFGPAVGVELSDAAVQLARQRYPQVQYFSGDILTWRWEGEPFDAVVSQEVIEHVPDQAGYLAVAARVLRPGGYLFLTTPNPSTLDAVPKELHKTWLCQPIELWLKRDELRALLEREFDVVSMSTRVLGQGHLGSHRLVNSVKFNGLLDAIGLRGAFRRWAQNAGYGMYQTIVARKR